MSDPESPLNHDPIPDPSPPPPLSSAQNIVSAEPLATVTDLTIPAGSKSSRRLPPPCWSLEETIALIDAYRDKWYSLNRGNLKASHWDQVAEAVAANCPDVTLKKTAVQCRHKMEKLRKRYRTEIQRARSVPVARFISSWVHFKRMEAMDNRPETKPANERDEEARFQFKNGSSSVERTKPVFFNRNGGGVGGSSSSGGIRIRIPTGVSIAQPGPRFPGKIEQKYTASPSSGLAAMKRGREVKMAETVEEEEDDEEEDDDPVMKIASAIKLLGDTLLRREQRKMEMTREIEAMRMEMEMKKTKMILESQQRIVEAFAKSISENGQEKKKMKMKKSRTSDQEHA